VTTLQAVHGRIVELRRHTNVHLYGRRPFGPTDRYELWIKPPDGAERKEMGVAMEGKAARDVAMVVKAVLKSATQMF